MSKRLMIIFFFSFISVLFAQSEKSDFGISFSGFVKTDAFFDTRVTTAIREGHFLLYPVAEKLDTDGKDINEYTNFNILSIQTRLHGKITGPDAFGAKTSGVIEGEFFGTSDADVNGFRLRHAFVKLDWANVSLLVGQTWHPMFISEMFPGVVSFNTGAPFQPFSRNPQIRFTYSIDNFKFIAVAASQRDFTSSGPENLGSAYLRNSALPNLHGQIQYANGGHIFGVGVDYKKIRPRTVTTKNIVTDEAVSGISFIGYTKLNLDPVTIKLEGVLGENLSDLMQLGGYAVKSVDTTSGVETYTTLSSFSVWGDISTGKDIEFGVFAGYSKNNGTKDPVVGSYYGRGTNIDNLLRVSPRIQFNCGKTRISTELEYTSAGYGTNNNADKGKIENIKTVSNIRVLLAVFYFF